MYACAVLQQGLIAATVSHNSSQWKLKWNLELINIFVGVPYKTLLLQFGFSK
ncbi:hypothetical protein Sjap_009197 [Stephania japonica]|uniref:Uncharacterized protein n=1 Tax=Stephania japonica TaxID=461633 RepID=A0AAP0JSG9_9MAGN